MRTPTKVGRCAYAAAFIGTAILILLAACGGSPSTNKFGRLIEYVRSNERPSGRLFPLYALHRRDELSRPQHQRSDPQGRARRNSGSAVQSSSRPKGLVVASAPERWQRTESSRGAAGEGAGTERAQCMHAHGVALPDPGSDGRIPDPSTVGLNQGSSPFESANQACGKYRPPYMPSNAQSTRTPRHRGHEYGDR